jgi:hypothetical protein
MVGDGIRKLFSIRLIQEKFGILMMKIGLSDELT